MKLEDIAKKLAGKCYTKYNKRIVVGDEGTKEFEHITVSFTYLDGAGFEEIMNILKNEGFIMVRIGEASGNIYIDFLRYKEVSENGD